MPVNPESIMEIVKIALEVENGDFSMETKSEDIEEWDSLGHLSILIALDKAFDGKVGEIRELASVDSVSNIVSILDQNSLELE